MMLVLFSVSISTAMCAQRVAVSTDVFKWATLSPNVSFDVRLSPNMTLNIEGAFNPFGSLIEGFSLKHIMVSPEIRYWFKRPLYSHYLGANIVASTYDIMIKNIHNKGQTIAIGVGYGYSFIVNERMSLTPNIGIGCGYVLSYTDPELNELSPTKGSFKPILTRIGLSLSYIID